MEARSNVELINQTTFDFVPFRGRKVLIRTVGIQFGQNLKFTKNIVINLEIGINWEHVLWHVHRNANWVNLI